jgi:hypothetical protein
MTYVDATVILVHTIVITTTTRPVSTMTLTHTVTTLNLNTTFAFTIHFVPLLTAPSMSWLKNITRTILYAKECTFQNVFSTVSISDFIPAVMSLLI